METLPAWVTEMEKKREKAGLPPTSYQTMVVPDELAQKMSKALESLTLAPRNWHRKARTW